MVTSLYAAIFGLILVMLSINVIRTRRRLSIGIGDATNMEMRRSIRAQANFTEYTPLFLILLGCAEFNNLPFWLLNLFGVLFLLGRLMHAYSLLKAEKYINEKMTAKPVWRIRGMLCTFTVIAILSLLIFVYRLVALLG